MFVRFQDLTQEELPPDRWERANAIGAGLANAELVEIVRHFVKLRLPGIDDLVDADMSRTGVTVYLGGFDWVTYPAPPHLLSRFPDLAQLPQQVFNAPEEEV